jgi:hypothetical protein
MRHNCLSRRHRRIERSLQICLWAAWTLVVAATAYMTWQTASIANQRVSRLALIVHCTLAGIVGLLVITWIEIHMAGWS